MHGSLGADSTPRRHLFGIEIDAVTSRQALEILEQRITAGRKEFVVTPNVDHLVQLQRNTAFRDAYARATLVVADGMPVIWAARLLGQPLPERVTGKHLLPRLLERAAACGWRVFLLGAAPDVNAEAERALKHRFPTLLIAGRHSPPFGFESDPPCNQALVRAINDARTDILVVALGAPKQELWVARHLDDLRIRCALGVGAALDFAAGALRSCPAWVERVGLEWLWRLFQEPRRLWRRYLIDDLAFWGLLFHELRKQRQRAPGNIGR
jgi:N-acetylglucosaminyldiphosphoundecaprenol N-acetyl-beta-D-mannosaminyltransferase